MPSRIDIQKKVAEGRETFQDTVRRRFLARLARYTGRDTIIYASAAFDVSVESLPPKAILLDRSDIEGFMAALHGLKGKELDLILHSPGGFADVAAQIVGYLRGKYGHIRAIVPHSAMSAATMIACACDEIIMGRQSALGPIDPQITFPFQGTHHTAPAHSLLAEFGMACQAVQNQHPSAPIWLQKMASYPHGILDQCQNAILFAQHQVGQWLASYMFRGNPNGQSIANNIAAWLSDATVHKSHGRPIMAGELRQQGLRVTMLENNQRLQDLVLSVFHATAVTFQVAKATKIIENHRGRGVYVAATQAR